MGKGGAQRIEPFRKEEREEFINPLRDQIQGLQKDFDFNQMFGLPAGETAQGLQAEQLELLRGTPAMSFLSGGAGGSGGAEGMFADAAGMVGSDPFGAKQTFQSFLDPGFMDVSNNPQVQGQIAAAKGRAQEFLNQNLDAIGSRSQAASGGVGRGSAAGSQGAQAGARAAALFGRQAADIEMGELARRQQMALGASQYGLNQGNAQAALLGQLAGSQGQLGAGLLANQLAGLSSLGGQFFAQQQAPLNLQFQLGELLKTSAGVRQPSFLEQVGPLLGKVNMSVANPGGAAGFGG